MRERIRDEIVETCSINENENSRMESTSSAIQVDSTPVNSSHTEVPSSLNFS